MLICRHQMHMPVSVGIVCMLIFHSAEIRCCQTSNAAPRFKIIPELVAAGWVSINTSWTQWAHPIAEHTWQDKAYTDLEGFVHSRRICRLYGFTQIVAWKIDEDPVIVSSLLQTWGIGTTKSINTRKPLFFVLSTYTMTKKLTKGVCPSTSARWNLSSIFRIIPDAICVGTLNHAVRALYIQRSKDTWVYVFGTLVELLRTQIPR